MKYELWCGNQLLGYSDLGYMQLSQTAFAGEFEPAPGEEENARQLAMAIHCMSAWMNRDTVDALGRHVVRPGFRNSRLFTAVTETITSRHNPALQLRRPDGTVVPTRHLVLQDMGTMSEHLELLEEAMRADAEQQTSEEVDPFATPEGRALLRVLEAEAEEELREERLEAAWRGDMHPDESLGELGDENLEESMEELDRELASRLWPPSHLNLHVMIEHAGDIPADTSWLTE